MQTVYKVLLLCGLLLGGHTVLAAQTKAERQARREQQVSDSIGARTYRIEVRTALPMSGRNVMLSHGFYLEVRADSLNSYLPYFGRAYSVPYGGGEGLDFQSAILDYKQEVGKKGQYEISFNVRTREDYYTFHLDIYPNGAANIHVNMQRRQSIDFMGDVAVDTAAG